MQVSRRKLLFGSVGLVAAGSAAGAGYWAFSGDAPRSLASLSGGDSYLTNTGVVFSPDGRELATPASPELLRWDTKTWRQLPPLLTSSDSRVPASCAYSFDGRIVAVPVEALFLMDRETGQVVQRVEAGPAENGSGDNGFGCAAFSGDGRYLAVLAQEDLVLIYAYADGKVSERPVATLHELPAANGASSALAFSPDSKVLAAGAVAGGITLWDVGGWQARQLPIPDSAGLGLDATLPTLSLGFSPSGEYVASGDVSVTVWNVRSGSSRSFHSDFMATGCQGIAFVGESYVLICNQSGGVALVDVVHQRIALTWSVDDSAPLGSVAVSPDVRTIAVGGSGECLVWALPKDYWPALSRAAVQSV